MSVSDDLVAFWSHQGLVSWPCEHAAGDASTTIPRGEAEKLRAADQTHHFSAATHCGYRPVRFRHKTNSIKFMVKVKIIC